MADDRRRAAALIRDLGRSESALARHAANRFDLRAVQAVRSTAVGLLETLSSIAHDDQFWVDLQDRAHVLSEQEIETLAWFDDTTLGAVLVASGYRTPPPPPVEELVSDTRQAVFIALEEGVRPELVDEARRRLILFLWRIRRQLTAAAEAPGAGSVDAVSRRLDIPRLEGVKQRGVRA